MLEVYLLGTGGMLPLPGRYLTSMLLHYGPYGVLVDCGEGTQMALREAGQGFKKIGFICLTHFHADHIAGLPGLLLTIGNSGRSEPLVIAGPKHVGQVVECLRIIAPQLPFPVRYCEVPEPGGKVLEIGGLSVSAQPVEHRAPCYAYRFDLPRQGKFLAEQARKLGVPVALWKALQNGEAVQWDGRCVDARQVLGPPRRGLRVSYATDLRPSKALSAFAAGSDLFICEGIYGDPALKEKAVFYRHCLFSEAAEMARDAAVRELWLTHFSPSMPHPEEYLQYASGIFPNVFVDRTHARLSFPQE